MKESKFIELLNLYVDHQISAADAELLETEVRNDPDRRKIYREYCQIQKACTELAAEFQAAAPTVSPKLAEFSPQRRSFGVWAGMTGLAAVAACAALVFVSRTRHDQPVTIPAPAVSGEVAALPRSVPMTVAQNVAPRPVLQPVFGPRMLTLRDQNSDFATAPATADRAAFADWMTSVQLTSMRSISPEELKFESKPALPLDVRTYRVDRPFDSKVEMTAFKFQR